MIPFSLQKYFEQKQNDIKITVTFWFFKLRKSSRYFIWYEFSINLIRFFLWLPFYWRPITRYLLKSRGVVRVDPVAFRHVSSSHERNLMTTTFWRKIYDSFFFHLKILALMWQKMATLNLISKIHNYPLDNLFTGEQGGFASLS